MNKRIFAVSGGFLLGLFVWAGCVAPPPPRVTATPSGDSEGDPVFVARPVVSAADAQSCPASSPTDDHPTDTDVFGAGPGAEWFCSPDNQLCAVKNGIWLAGDIKVGWRKPAAAQLSVQGRRLDGEGPPMHASVPDGYGGTFQASGLTFPTGGCWEVTARAGSSTLRFVVPVLGMERTPPESACDDLAGAVEASSGIVVGRVLESESYGSPYTWHTVAVHQMWKNPYGGRVDSFDLLRAPGEPALETGVELLLFVGGEPLRLVCPGQTLAALPYADGAQGIRLLAEGQSPLWSGETVEAVRREVQETAR